MSESFLTFAKELIVESNDAPKYGCLMAMISPELSGKFTEWAFDHINPDDVVPENGKTGYEDEPHITVIYGIHDNITAEEVLATIKDFGPIHVTLSKISKFKQDELDVLKIDVESQDLQDLNALLADKFKDSYTNKFPEYHPHMTLAYVKKGAAENLDMDTFNGFEMDINLVTYSYPEAKDKKTITLTEARQIPYQWDIKNVYLNGSRVSASKPVPSPSADGALAKFIWLMLSDTERVSRDTISSLYKKAKEIGGYKIQKVTMDAPREHPEPQNGFSHYPPTKPKSTITAPKQTYWWDDSTHYPLATGKDVQAFAGYEGWKGKIVMMSPDKFLSLAVRLSEPNLHNLERLRQHFKNQGLLDPLVLIVNGNKVVGHEGRHRAMVSKEHGIEKVPVLIIPRDFPRVPNWTADHHRTIDAHDFQPES